MSPRPWQAMREEIDLPAATAVWVLTAHVLTILSPLVVIAVVAANWSTVVDRTAVPWLFFASASMLVVASVAESAQNTLDRWYLTGVPPTLLDCVFGSLVVASSTVTVVAVLGTAWILPAVLVSLAFPVLYLLGGPTPIAQAVSGVASILALQHAFGDPVVWLSLVAVFLTLFFLDILLRTHQQAMHGFVTLVNAVGLMTTAVAISTAASGSSWSWPLVVAIAVVVVAIALAARKRLLALPPTPRRELAGAPSVLTDS